jgi:lipid-binding SYLF domain-containing protein
MLTHWEQLSHSNDHYKEGSDAASATDADIFTYGKAKGAFAGVSLGGATVEPDKDANHRVYNQTVSATDIVRGERQGVGEGESLVTALNSNLGTHK